MNTPFAGYSQLAEELFDLVTESGNAGELIAIIGLHENDAVIDWFDDRVNPDKAPDRRKRLLQAIVRLMAVYDERQLEVPLVQSQTNLNRFDYAFEDDIGAPVDVRDRAACMRLLPRLRVELAAMDDTRFERLCGYVLLAMGCAGVRVTRANKDRGVDVFGRLPVGTAANATASSRMALGRLFAVIVVQAKRYAMTDRIGPEEVRQLAGTWYLIRNARGNGDLEDHLDHILDELEVRMEDPAIQIVMTSAGFSGPARREARDGGLVLLDGRQLAALLARERLAVEKTAPGQWTTSGGHLQRLTARWPT